MSTLKAAAASSTVGLTFSICRKYGAKRSSMLPFVTVACPLLAGACGRSEPARQYQLRGYAVRLDPKTNLATIHNEKIDGWMDEMTMQYPVESRDQYMALRKGEKITATVNVASDGYWLTGVKQQPQEKP